MGWKNLWSGSWGPGGAPAAEKNRKMCVEGFFPTCETPMEIRPISMEDVLAFVNWLPDGALYQVSVWGGGILVWYWGEGVAGD